MIKVDLKCLPDGLNILSDGSKIYILNGKRHRTDGPAVEEFNGYKKWYRNGGLHREDGPAVEDNGGEKHWFLNDQRHREDGPASEYADGSKEWYLNNKYIDCKSQDEFEQLKKYILFW